MAFMGQDGWKTGLSAYQVTKVGEIEKQKEVLKAELSKKTMNFDMMQQTLEKEKRKVDEEKGNACAIQREMQSITERLCEVEKKNDKLQHDLSAKETQNTALQGQFEAKVRQLEAATAKLKKAEENLEQLEVEQQENLGAPPGHPSRQSFSVTPQKRDSCMARHNPKSGSDDDVGKKLVELQNIIDQKDQEIKDLEVKLFEKSSVDFGSNFDETPLPAPVHKSNPFDGVPLPTGAVKAKVDLGFSQIASRSRTSSIVFDALPNTPDRRANTNRRGVAPIHQQMMMQQQQPQQQQTLKQPNGLQNDVQLQQKQQQLEAARKDIQDLKMQCTKLEGHLANKEREFSTMQADLSKAKADLTETKKVTEVMGQEKTRTYAELTKSRNELESCTKTADDLREKLKLMQRETECQKHNAEAARLALEKKLEDQERELKNEVKEATSAAAQLEDKFNKERESAEKIGNATKLALDAAELQKTQSDRELVTVKEELKQVMANNENLALTTAKWQPQVEEMEQEVARLQTALQDTDVVLAKQENSIKELNESSKFKEKQEMVDKLEQLKLDYENAKKDLLNANQRCDELMAVKEEQLQQITGLQEQVDSHKGLQDQVAHMQQEMSATRAEFEQQVKTLNQDLLRATEELKTKQGLVEQLGGKLKATEEQYQSAKTFADTSESQIKKMQRELEAKTESLQEHKENVASLQLQLADAKQNDKLDSLQHTIGALETQLTDAHDKRKEQEDRVQEKQVELDNMEASLQQFKLDKADMEQNLLQLQNKFNDVVNHKNSEIEALKEAHSKALEEASADYTQLKSSLETMAAEKVELQEQLEKQQDLCLSLQAKVNQIQEYLEEYKEKEKNWDTVKATMTDKTVVLEQEVESLSGQLESEKHKSVNIETDIGAKETELVDVKKELAEKMLLLANQGSEKFALQEKLQDLQKDYTSRLENLKANHDQNVDKIKQEHAELLVEHEDRQNKLDKDIEAAKEQCVLFKTMAEERGAQVVSLKETLNKHEAKLEEIQTKYDNDQVEVVQLQEKNLALTKDVETLTAQIKTVRTSSANVENDIDAMEAELSTIKEELAEKVGQLDLKCAESLDLQAKLTEMQRDSAKKLEEVRSDHAEVVHGMTMTHLQQLEEEVDKFRALETSYEAIKEDCEDFKHKSQVAKCQVEKLEHELNSNKVEVDELHKKFDSEKAEKGLLQEKNHDLVQEMETLNRNLEDLKKKCMDAENELDAKDVELVQAKKEVEDKDELLEQAIMDKCNLEEKVADLDNSFVQGQVESLEMSLKKMEQEHSEEMAGKELQCKSMQDNIDALESERKELAAKCQDFQTRVSELEHKRDSLMVSIGELQNNVDAETSDKETIVAKIKELDQALETLNVQLDQEKSSRLNLENEVSAKDAQLSDLTTDLNDKREVIVALESKVQRLEHDNGDLVQRVGEYQALKDKFTFVQGKMQRHEVEMKECLETIAKLEQGVCNMETSKESEINDLNEFLTKQTEKNTALYNELNKNKINLQEAQQQVETLETKNAQLSKELSEAVEANNKCLQDSKEKLDQADAQISDLQAKLDQVNSGNEEVMKSVQEKVAFLQKESKTLEEKISTLENTNSQHQDALKIAEIKCDDIQTQMESEMQKQQVANKNLEAIKLKLSEKLETVQSQLIKVESEVAERDRERDSMKEQLAEKVTELEKIQDERTSMLNKLEDNQKLKEDLNLLQHEKEKLSEQIAKLWTENKEQLRIISATETEHADLRKELEAKVQDKEDAYQTVENEKQVLANQLDDIKQQLISLQLVIEEKESHQKVLKTTLEEQSVKITALEEEKCDNLENRGKVEELEKDLIRVKEERTTLVEKISVLKQENSRHQEVLSAAEIKYDDLKHEMEAKMQEKESTCKNLEDAHEKLRGQLVKVESQLANLETAVNDSERIQTDLREQLEEKVAQLAKVEAEHTDLLAKELDSSKLQEDVALLHKEKERLSEQISKLWTENKEQLCIISATEKEHADLRKELEAKVQDKEAAYQTVQGEKENLATQLEQVHQQMDEIKEYLATVTSEKEDEAKEKQDLKVKVESLEKSLLSEKESWTNKIKLLLGQQKKLEVDMSKVDEERGRLLKENEELQKSAVDKDELRKEVMECQKQIQTLEQECNNDEQIMPWETDEELKGMRPMELRSILANELNSYEKSRLNEMCIKELEKELVAKVTTESDLICQLSSLEKDLQRTSMKLKFLEEKRQAAKTVLTTDSDLEINEAPLINRSKRINNKSINNLNSTRMTRSKSRTSVIISSTDDNEEEPLASSTKRPLASSSNEDEQEENSDQKRQRRSNVKDKPRSGRASELAKSMPENPFSRKSVIKPSKLNKSRPLETITNNTERSSESDK